MADDVAVSFAAPGPAGIDAGGMRAFSHVGATAIDVDPATAVALGADEFRRVAGMA